MTLINYMSRVHFADGVLEVALSAELELNRLSRPVLISDEGMADSEFSERVSTGMPFWCEFTSTQLLRAASRQDSITALKQTALSHRADVLIAYGSALSLRIADACRREMQAHNRSGASDLSPALFAIPGVDGLPALASLTPGSRFSKLSRQGIQPTTVIIDPTLIIGESAQRTASAAANTLARCLSACFSSGYNPPADGIALDGYKRIVRHLKEIVATDSLEMRRELMAASLNGTLAMEKEPGIAHHLCHHLIRNLPDVDEGSLMRVLIVVEAQMMEHSWDKARMNELCRTLEVPENQQLSQWLIGVLSKLPLPGSLKEMNIAEPVISAAVDEVTTQKAAAIPSARRLVNVLNTVDFNNFDQPVRSTCTH
ncbi:MAG: iron-containing alcohol dehydrogenase [Pseudomonadota bacterium]